MKTTPKARPSNVTPFVLAGRWALDGLDRRTMRWLSKVAKRKRLGVIYEAVESFVAKCEAEADLENKIIKFRTLLKGGIAPDRRFEFQKSTQLFIRAHNKTL